MMTIITLDKFEHEGGQHDLISSRKTRQFDKIPPWASPDAKAITRKEERIWVSVLCICYCGVQIKSPLHHFTRNNTLGSQLIGPCGVVFGHKALPRIMPILTSSYPPCCLSPAILSIIPPACLIALRPDILYKIYIGQRNVLMDFHSQETTGCDCCALVLVGKCMIMIKRWLYWVVTRHLK